MKILITGGAGFIGGNLVYYMLKNHSDYEITVFDKLTYAGNKETLKGAMDKINFVQGDIADKATVDNLFHDCAPDIVINLAAESHVDRSIVSADDFLRTNIIGTQVLLDACVKYGVRRFHQVSTDEVYGDLPLDKAELKFTEMSPLKPSSPYSASKAGADLMVMAYHRTYGLPISISRSSNNYGAYQFPEKLIPLMIVNALSNKPLPVYGTGKNVRDWIYVEDHCRAIDMIIHGDTVGEIYNVGGSCEKANIDIVKAILKILGKSQNLISYVEDRKGHDLRYALDLSKIEKELSWSAKTDFKNGIEKTVKWYIENRAWLDKILSGGKY